MQPSEDSQQNSGDITALYTRLLPNPVRPGIHTLINEGRGGSSIQKSKTTTQQLYGGCILNVSEMIIFLCNTIELTSVTKLLP